MQAPYRARLSEAGRTILQTIERIPNARVEVALDDRPADADSAVPDRMAVEVNEHCATIKVRSPTDFSSEGALHELLHVERYWCAKVPVMIMPLDDFHSPGLSSQLNNQLEHLVILPRQKELGEYDSDRWNRILANACRLLAEREAHNQRIWVPVTWALMQIVGVDEPTESLGRELLQRSGLEALSRAYVDDVRTLLSSKERLVHATALALGIPVSNVDLVYYYPETQTQRIVPLSAIEA